MCCTTYSGPIFLLHCLYIFAMSSPSLETRFNCIWSISVLYSSISTSRPWMPCCILLIYFSQLFSICSPYFSFHNFSYPIVFSLIGFSLSAGNVISFSQPLDELCFGSSSLSRCYCVLSCMLLIFPSAVWITEPLNLVHSKLISLFTGLGI
jgi:hypothetical protein